MKRCGNCEYRRQSKLTIQFNEIPIIAYCDNKNSPYYNKYIWDTDCCSEWKGADIRETNRLPSDPHDITYINALKNRIKELEVDRPQGEWIEDPINKNNMYCSNCKVSYTKDFLQGMSLYHEPKDMPNYCPNCGAKMKGADDERADL